MRTAATRNSQLREAFLDRPGVMTLLSTTILKRIKYGFIKEHVMVHSRIIFYLLPDDSTLGSALRRDSICSKLPEG